MVQTGPTRDQSKSRDASEAPVRGERTVGFLGRVYIRFFLYKWSRLAGLTSLLFFRTLFPGFRVGKTPRIWGWFWVQIAEGGTIVIGDGLHMVSASARSSLSHTTRCQLTVGPRGRIELGDHVELNG